MKIFLLLLPLLFIAIIFNSVSAPGKIADPSKNKLKLAHPYVPNTSHSAAFVFKSKEAMTGPWSWFAIFIDGESRIYTINHLGKVELKSKRSGLGKSFNGSIIDLDPRIVKSLCEKRNLRKRKLNIKKLHGHIELL